MAASNEVAKLQQHLDLLRDQFIKLQQKHAILEQKHSQVIASSGDVDPEHFVTRLLSMVSGLYEKPLYSDLTINLKDKTVQAHKMILCARSRYWLSSDEDLLSTDSLDLGHLSTNVASLLIRWVYTDSITMPSDQKAVIELLSAANLYQLKHLKEKCEQSLISEVNVHNCIRLYQTSEEHKAEQLKEYCLKVISSRWNDLDTNDFADLSAPLLYNMFKVHSKYPLHLAVQHLREDVVFMFVIEHNLELSTKLSEMDDAGNIPLDLALLVRHEGIANTLVTNKCDLNVKNRDGYTLLHLAILRGDVYAASFLIKNGASTIVCTGGSQESPLHLVASYSKSDATKLLSRKCPIKKPPTPSDSMADIASLLLEYHGNADAQDKDGFTPLQRAIVNSNREVFTVLLNNPVLNLEVQNSDGMTALWLALQQLDPSYTMTVEEGESAADGESFAAQIISKGADPNNSDIRTGNTLLHRASLEGNESASIFLVRHGANVDRVNEKGEAPIHIAAIKGLHHLTKMLLMNDANPNLSTNRKPVEPPSQPIVVIDAPPSQPSVTHPPDSTYSSAMHSLVSSSSKVPESNPFDDFSSLDQLSALGQQIEKAPSLAGSTNPFGDDSDEEDNSGSVPVTTTSRPQPVGGHAATSNVVQTEQANVEGNSVKEFISSPYVYDIITDPGQRTALHLAVIHKHSKVIEVILKYRGGQTSVLVDQPDGFSETPLSLSLWTGQFETALKFINAGADVEYSGIGEDNMSLLFQAIVREIPSAALFLLNNGANFKKRTSQNETLLLMAIRHQLEEVADRLCEMGSDVGAVDVSGNSPLWVALRSRQQKIASRLVSHGCEPNAWHTTPDGSSLSLLHRAIQLRDSITACFLIESGADVVREAKFSDGASAPSLHLACERGLSDIVQSLVDHHADINAKDSNGQTALHSSILSKNPRCSEILLNQPRIDVTLKDSKGQTPFAVAMATKDNETGRAILKCEPKAAEQMDNKGLNFLHHAVLNKDVESVIFLLSVAVNVNSVVQNPTRNTPLHFAVKNGAEILVRHLLLAGADVEAVDNHNRGVLHMAVEGNYSTILSIILENNANPDHTDEEGNNALHSAMMFGNESCIRVILEDSDINLGAVNMNGRNCLHMLAATHKDNSPLLFEMLMRVAPKFPLDRQDIDGNTPLLLAYHCGSTALCDSLVQYSAHPGIANKQNISIFNAPVATKQLLFRILDQIRSEPSWLEGQYCMDCNTKFNISHRKHHCRHCGRLLCNKCTSQQMPIIKFDLNKPVRVCEVCSDSFKLKEAM